MRIGKRTVFLEKPPVIAETAAIVGEKEGEGPLGSCFDEVLEDDCLGEKSWEKAESKLQEKAAKAVLQKAGLCRDEISCILAGDLLNQCVGTHYAMRNMNIPFIGLYGACSTMAESMMLGSMLVSGNMADNALCVTSSHFCSAEKQYRFPLEYGGQRAPSAQWTVTGSGAALILGDGAGPFVHAVCAGKIIDMGINDVNNMGGAMAGAAADTLTAVFEDTNTVPGDYDLILTGDLASVGSDVLCEIMDKNGYNIYPVHNDCGKMIFDLNAQDVHAGGSGCGCAGSVFCGHIAKELKCGKLKRIIFMATGALMNPQTLFQGETIPAIAHALIITTDRKAFFKDRK